MPPKILLVTPPFVQLNTPYPATVYLKGFCNTIGVPSFQMDLGLEVILRVFSRHGLRDVFEKAAALPPEELSENALRMIHLEQQYLQTIEPVIRFLQNKNQTLAHLICTGNYLPAASRFEQVADLEWAFGNMGIQDKARHLATLYLEDLGDLISECIDPHFGFSRYAERISTSASSFDGLETSLSAAPTFILQQCFKVLMPVLEREIPDMVAFSVPFPGNLFAALGCGKWIKAYFPHIKVLMGGGYPNTELRSLSDSRVFDYVDFITLDDGEAPLRNIIEHLEGKRPVELLKRTFVRLNGEVQYMNGSLSADVRQAEVGTPDYSDLPTGKYLSVIEMANPMHRLWSDGRWNKMTLAHGCYWGKCTFCDISLDYIRNYEATTAAMLVDRMQEMIKGTGEYGFHFVDEAAPPALMRDVALEILRREMTVVWWTNIRFEKNFTEDLCRLLAASGCIAVSGGLEVASDRLLRLIDKGITVAQVAKVTDNFTKAGIMVHAYLMYGFPTQTAQETIDSLEMVRQLFELGIVQSGFWHQFAMTAHSPIGLQPEQFQVEKLTVRRGAFANNDLQHIDPAGADHIRYAEGLRKSLFNYMHGLGFEFPLQDWFDFKVPRTSVAPDYLADAIDAYPVSRIRDTSKVVWLGEMINNEDLEEVKNGFHILMRNKNTSKWIKKYDEEEVQCLNRILELTHYLQPEVYTYGKLKKELGTMIKEDFETFWQKKIQKPLSDMGLLVL